MNTLYQSLVSVEPFTLLVTILNLFLQLYLIKKFLLNKVRDVLDLRQKAADQQIREAEQVKKEAGELRDAYKIRMDQAKQEADRIVYAAQRTAQEQSDRIIHQAKTQASQIKEKATVDMEMEKKKTMSQAQNEISDMAITIAGRALGRCLTQQDQNRLAEEVIRQLGRGV